MTHRSPDRPSNHRGRLPRGIHRGRSMACSRWARTSARSHQSGTAGSFSARSISRVLPGLLLPPEGQHADDRGRDGSEDRRVASHDRLRHWVGGGARRVVAGIFHGLRVSGRTRDPCACERTSRNSRCGCTGLHFVIFGGHDAASRTRPRRVRLLWVRRAMAQAIAGPRRRVATAPIRAVPGRRSAGRTPESR